MTNFQGDLHIKQKHCWYPYTKVLVPLGLDKLQTRGFEWIVILKFESTCQKRSNLDTSFFFSGQIL